MLDKIAEVEQQIRGKKKLIFNPSNFRRRCGIILISVVVFSPMC
jgi:hypothetical protein